MNLIEDIKDVAGQKFRLGLAEVPDLPGKRKVILAEVDGETRVMDALCPHAGHDLSCEEMSDKGVFICPLHNWVIKMFGTNAMSFEAKEVDGKFYLIP